MHDQDKKLKLSLLILRLSVFLVMYMWTIEKFLNPGHGIKVFKDFYFMGGLDERAMYLVGAIEMLLLLGFVVGYKKKITYGAVLILHAVSTLSSIKQYLAPFEDANMLFFAAWPMLAACFVLFIMRDSDTKWTIGK
ncbi:MAG: hypothetical protein KJO88_06300 [Gammaproteobacteria bacterium]|nr:hypothetical protein [Gammaproteobacteria bacterium]NNM12817.1 hypothetical protein [Gammaproteobacteria bacterium]